MLPNYLSTYPGVIIGYHVNNMVLISKTNAAYLVLRKSRLRAAAWFRFDVDPNKKSNQKMDTPVNIMCNTIKNVMASVEECKTGITYMAIQRTQPICLAVIELRNPRPQTRMPMYTNKSTTEGILTSSMCQDLTKSSDMRF